MESSGDGSQESVRRGSTGLAGCQALGPLGHPAVFAFSALLAEDLGAQGGARLQALEPADLAAVRGEACPVVVVRSGAWELLAQQCVQQR